jgi:Zn-dependent M28 family amino/carboxypeptidase
VIADTRYGDATHTVVVGAHLDSVVEGPGINDNGSGSAAILETACKMGWLNIKPKYKVRFAFWSAEEEGLIGSTYYVDNLPPEELAKISMNLNFDMLASHNYVRFVYDGDGSDTPDPGPPGSGQIEQVFNDYFAQKGLPTDPTALDGRSDYDPFATANIPVGGLFAGADSIKTEEQALKYGGTAGEQCDSCYHTPCDNTDNLNYTIEKQMLKGIGYTVYHYAMNPLTVTTAKPLKALRAATYQADYKGPLAIR